MRELGFGPRYSREVSKLFSYFDGDGDGRIRYREFVQFINARVKNETSSRGVFAEGDSVEARHGGKWLPITLH